MPHAGYVHLRVHSAYSLSEGAIKLEELVTLCQRQRMPAVAVTDSGNLFGALEFVFAACDGGIQPIVGCELALAREVEGPGNGGNQESQPEPLVVLVKDASGYGNLLHLISRAFLDSAPGEKPQVALAALEASSDGLIALSGGPQGPLGRLIRDSRQGEAEALARRLAAAFPGRFYIELLRHGLPEEAESERGLLELAYALELPLVATNNAHFADADMYEAHDALLCIADGTYVAESDRRRLTPEHRFKSAEEMRALFADIPEAVDNTVVIARRCAYFPEAIAPILPAFPTDGGRSEAEELRHQAVEGLEARLADHVFALGDDESHRDSMGRHYRERLDYELGVIEQMGFPGYFLIVADFIKWAKQHGIPVGPGRGSGAGSVTAWALTITDLDPLRWGLLFERFLNPERVSMPDFDIDFCQERRDEVIRYVQQKYGQDRVAQIITFGKLQARAALRDVGRVLQLPYGQVDRICKLVPNNPANPVTLQDAILGEPQLQAMQEEEAVARLIDIALKLEGLYRHASTHAAGIVIGNRPLEELVPLYRDPRSSMPATQFSMKYVESAGLVKFDFLGLKTLTVLARACELLTERGIDLDLTRIPLDDAKTYEMLARAETVGVFQLESSGMRDALRRLKADRFEEIIAVVALYRPGPMDNIPSFINRKHGEEEPDYLYPTLEGILKETFGIMIYQEQVMQIAQELAGFSLGSADLLRRAMGKKIRAEMTAQRSAFVEGAKARGVPEAKGEQIFEQVDKFAGYGFNKSHAAAYALVAYQTAYMKANYPVELLAASMTFDLGNTDKLNIFRQELDRLGIALLPPNINRSRADFSVESQPDGTPAIRYALAAVKNVGAQAMGALVAEREAKGPFKTISDFAARLDPKAANKRQIENLAAAGAFDGLNANRRQVYEAAETISRYALAAAGERESNQINLFGGAAAEPPVLPLPRVVDWPAIDRLRQEFEAIGFYLSAHPLDAYGQGLARLGVVASAELPKLLAIDAGRKKLAGIVIGRQERTSRQGNRFAFAQLSDTSGVYEVVVFSDLLAKSRELLAGSQPLLIAVDGRLDGEGVRLIAQEIDPLDEAVAKSAAGLKIFLREPEPLPRLRSLLDREPSGRGRVALVLGLGDGQEVELELDRGYRLGASLRQAIKAIPGVVVQDL